MSCALDARAAMRTAFTNALTLHRLCLRSMIERHEAQNGFIHRLIVVTGLERFIFKHRSATHCCATTHF